MATSAGTIPISATFNGAQLEKDVLSALNRIQSKSTLNLNTRNFTQPLGKITGLANEFNKSLEASNARVVAFGASAGLIFAVQKSFTALVASTIEVEKSLTDINIVLNTSSKGIKQFGDQLFDVARQTGAAFKDVAGAATEFSRQGLGLQETLKRTRDALILTRLSGLDVVSSTEALTAAVNSFTKEALTTTDVVNKLAAVDAKFAVSSRDLSEALQRVGSSASEAGVSFDELLGIVTSVQQTTARGGAVIGNALKTIFTRIERPQVIRDLKDFGITVSDISGNALPTIKVIENLAQSFQNLNPVIKSQVAELVGGVYQINILKAALADVSKQNSAFAEATRTSSLAADEAIIKNDALNKSLSALINETTVNFTQFASKIGDVSIAPGIRKILSNIVNPALESFNNKEVEGVGAKIATGLLTGLTDFITGPGLGLGALAVGKLIANFTGFAGDAAKNLLGVGKDQAIIQGEISKILSSNPQLIQQIIAGSKSRLQVEKEIKQILIEQAAISKSIKDNSKDITGRFLASGLTVSPETGLIGGRRSAGGYIPAKQQAAEMVGAMQGGYAPGKVVAAPKSIGGVMNTAETVKYVPGFAQPYILPPQGSSAARNLTSKSMAKNGINPYQARGFVPNFAGTDFTNEMGYADSEWFRKENPFPVPLSQIKVTNKAGDESGFDGTRFYKKDKNGNELKFTAIDLNAFLKRGATYGDLRRYAPDYILKTDPRFGKRKPDGSAFTVDDIRKDFVPGKKVEGENIIGEGIKKVYNAYIPPASMLVFDATQKSSERDINEDDLEGKIGEMSTKRKTSGRIFRIKSYALNASALNEEKTGLIQKTQDFSRKMTKDLANYIRPGAYSDTSVDEFFNRAGKNYSVLAGTIFEASTNLAANYTRDKSNVGGDFDVRGGNIGNVRELFPGFTDQYGDYKLKNNDEAIRSFIDKVTKQYGQQIGDHFKEQEIKAGSVTSGLKTSSLGFIPNFAPKPFNFRFSNLGEKTAQISPKLRDWLADKYFDPEMASPEMLERLASLNRDSGAFFATLENPNAVAGIPVRGQQGFVSRQNRGARAGALLNALRTRLPNFVPGSLPTLASGFVPNFLKEPKVPKIKSFKTGEGERVLGPAPIVNRQTKEEFVKKVLEGKQAKSYLRYSRKDDSIDVDFVRSSRRGDGGFLWDRAGSIAKRLGLPLTTSAFLPQKENLKKYDAETGSFEEVLATGFPQLKWSQRGKALRTKLNLYNDYSEYPIESKATFLEVKNKLNDIYKYDAPALKDSILRDNTYIQDIISYFAKGFIPNFNPVQEAMKREMSAGYSSSQVKLGQNDKLRTSFNPMGLGVYNSEEGSLNNGIGLAEKAGIDPKTKGMSAKGYIPNFAETSGFDLFAMTAAFSALIFSVKQTAQSLNELKTTNQNLKKDYASAAGSYAQQMGQLPKDFKKRQQQIGDEIENTFTNINRTTLKLKGTSTAPLVMGPPTRDKFGIITRSPQAASPEQLARLQELRDQLAEEIKKTREGRRSSREAMKEAGAGARAIDAPYFGKGMFAQNSKLSGLLKAVGPGAAVGVSTLLSVGSQFIPEKNKQARAAVSGVSDIAQYTGTGAAFGAPGAAVGFLVGLGFALKKLSDAKAEEAIDKINERLDTTKEKAAEFSGAAQNYSTSLESLQSALNDPKSRPEALLRFQNNLTEALNSIPIEFKDKVLKAGTDITKVAEAIAGINKELGNTQKNLEKQLAITQIIKEESSIFGPASVSAKNQKQLNALFASSVNPESVIKSFGGGSGAADFGSFIESLKSQAIYDKDVYSMSGGMVAAQKIGTERAVNKEAVEGIKSELKSRGILTEDIANQLDQAFSSLKPEAIESIIDALKKQGLSILDNSKRSKILSEILEDNTKRIRKNEEALKSLSEQYNNINLQISNQIDIEKNRAKTIREINKIQAEGNISIQRARVKGLLDASSSFISEGAKNDIQGQLDVNEIITRQNSKIQDATNSLLDSFTEAVVKKSEEARSKAETAITDASRGPEDIQKERFRFQQTIQQLNPLISQSLKDINSGGNVGDIKQLLTNQIRTFANFKPEERDVLIQTLEGSLEDFKNKLAEIKAQGDIDLQIQEAQREYQKQSLALNQRLSFAGGAQALGSTGRAGVSDLFDNVSDLVSELRQTNTIGNAAQRGSSAFKLLDVLTNQLQLNRSVINPPAGFNKSEDFNRQVSSDLGPLAATAIAGRVQQIREGLDLARRVTEIQTGKQTAGTALGAAFDQAKEGAVRTALDQIASQFKLENMGSYLDVLQQEARFLNDLTQDQNEILAQTLPTTLNQNFKSVITEQVGNKLNTLTSSLTEVINKLSTSSQRNAIETEMYNSLPTDLGPTERNIILRNILGATDLKDGSGIASMQSNDAESAIRIGREQEIKKLQAYFDSFEILTVTGAQGIFSESFKKIIGDTSKTVSRDDFGNITGGIRYEKGYYGTGTSKEALNSAIALQEDLGSSIEDQEKNQRRLKQLIESREKAIGRVSIDTSGTYDEFVRQQSKQFGTKQLTVQQVKDIQSANARKQALESAPALMSQKRLPLDEIIDQYDLLGSTKQPDYKSREVGSQLANARANSQRINELLINRLETDKDLVDLNERVNKLLKQDAADTQKREELIKLQTELRAKTLEQENKIAKEQFDLYYKSEFGRTFFRDEKAAQANAVIESEARQGRVAVGAITQKNTEYNRADFARDTGQLIDTFQTDFKSGIASAFGEAIKGTKTLKDAFRDMFQGILNRMLDKSLEMGVDALFAFGKAAAGFKNGGEIKKYNSGGMVVGGSGMKDDVPAMMSGGEFVIKKSSVNKYGANYLRALNGGLVPRYAAGGFSIGPLQNEFLYDNPERPTSGEFAVDSRLSAMALTDENNPQNRLRQDRYEKLDQYLQDRAQFEKDKQQALKNYRNQVNSTFYSGLISAGVQLGAAGLTIGAQSMKTPTGYTAAEYKKFGVPEGYGTAEGIRGANGGYIPKFAGGGYTGKDSIPALLMGGEYVMNKKAVDMYGRDFMGQLNSGTLPKYAAGGMVGTSYTGQNSPQTSIEELVTALNTLNESLSKDTAITQAESNKSSIAGATQESGMSVVNNISINVAQGGEVTSEANSTTQQGKTNTQNSQNNIQNNAKLGELLRSKVVEVLVEQKRPGGLLYASR